VSLPAAPGSYEQAQFAGIEHLLAVAREQAAAPGTMPFPATLPLPSCPDTADQIAQLEAEAAGVRR